MKYDLRRSENSTSAKRFRARIWWTLIWDEVNAQIVNWIMECSSFLYYEPRKDYGSVHSAWRLTSSVGFDSDVSYPCKYRSSALWNQQNGKVHALHYSGSRRVFTGGSKALIQCGILITSDDWDRIPKIMYFSFQLEASVIIWVNQSCGAVFEEVLFKANSKTAGALTPARSSDLWER